MTDGEIFLLSVLLKRPGNQRASQTWRRVDVALSCHAVVHLETVMSDLGAVFRSYSRACLAPAGHGMLCCKPAGSCSIVWEVDSSWNQTWQHIDPLWAQIMDPKMIQHSFCLYLPIFFPPWKIIYLPEWHGSTVQKKLFSYAKEVLYSASCAENLVLHATN